jgi:hypothetical protein
MLRRRDTHREPSRAGESGMLYIAGLVIMAIVLGVALYAISKTVSGLTTRLPQQRRAPSGWPDGNLASSTEPRRSLSAP